MNVQQSTIRAVQQKLLLYHTVVFWHTVRESSLQVLGAFMTDREGCTVKLLCIKSGHKVRGVSIAGPVHCFSRQQVTQSLRWMVDRFVR